MPKKESLEDKKARLLAHVHEGELDFAASLRRSAPVSFSAVIPPAPAPSEVPTPPNPAEPFRFSKQPYALGASLRARGWMPGNSLYDPVMRAAAMRLAADLGIHFAELQHIALGFLLDETLRPAEAQEMLHRLRKIP